MSVPAVVQEIAQFPFGDRSVDKINIGEIVRDDRSNEGGCAEKSKRGSLSRLQRQFTNQNPAQGVSNIVQRFDPVLLFARLDE